MKFSEQFIEIMEYLGEKLGVAIDWGQENVLPYIEELVRRITAYKITTTSIGVASGLILIIISIVFIKKMSTSYLECKKDHNDRLMWEYYRGVEATLLGGLAIGGIVILIFIAICIFFSCLTELLQWIFIPEVPLIDLVRGYVDLL